MITKKALIVEFEFFTWGYTLAAITALLVHITRWFNIISPILNEYHYMILAGGVGGIWSYGLFVANANAKIIKDGTIEYKYWKKVIYIIIATFILVFIGIRVSLG